MISLEWYQSFVAIYRTGTVSRAAEARFLTQPAVSQHLAGLEAAIGEPLFRRLPRAMVPTERGKELYTRIAQSLDTLQQISQSLHTGVAERPLIRLGSAPEYFGEIALAQLRSLPIKLAVQFGTPQTLIPALERGELDLVIASQRHPAMSIEYRKLTDEHFVLVGGMQHSQAPGDPSLVQSWLESQPWISYGAELPIIRRFWQQSFQTRPNFQPVLILPNLRIIAQAVEYGYGLGILPAYLCQRALADQRIQILWQPPQPVSNELWLAMRRIDRNRPELEQVCTALQEDLPDELA